MTWTCTYCGHPNLMNYTHCSKCGRPRGRCGRLIVRKNGFSKEKNKSTVR